jgi:hypothetical protein
MIPALIAGAAVVLAGLIAAIGQWLNSRNDRQLTLLEVELHSKMPPEAKAASLELEHVIDHRIHRWYLSTRPFARTLRATVLAVALAYLFAAIYTLILYVTDRTVAVTRLSGFSTDLLAVTYGAVWAFVALAIALALAGVVWSIWPKTWPRGWDPKAREAPPTHTQTQGNGDSPNAMDAAASKLPSTPAQKN